MKNLVKYFTITLVISLSLVFLGTQAMANPDPTCPTCPTCPEYDCSLDPCENLGEATVILEKAYTKLLSLSYFSRLSGRWDLIKAYSKITRAEADLIICGLADVELELDILGLPGDLADLLGETVEITTTLTLLQAAKAAIVTANAGTIGVIDHKALPLITTAEALVGFVNYYVCECDSL